MNNNRLKLFFGTSLAALLLAGCMVGPKYHQPAATVQPPPAAYKELPAQNPPAGEWKVAQPQDAMLHGKWWEIYSDPELNALEDQLNINNQNIKQSFENFMEARTLVTQARSQLYPTLGTTPSFRRSQSSATLRNNVGATGTAGGGTGGNPNVYSTLAEVPFTASWAPDLWGRVRNTIRQAQYNAQLSAADLENERLTEQASLAVFFFELRGQDALQKLLCRNFSTIPSKPTRNLSSSPAPDTKPAWIPNSGSSKPRSLSSRRSPLPPISASPAPSSNTPSPSSSAPLPPVSRCRTSL